MAQLEYSVYVAPSKVAVSDDLPPGEARRMWSPTASTLIHGEHDAVLVDPLLTVDESRALADWVVSTGKNVTTVFVTHAHGDHFFGAPAILERFPDARVVAAPGVVAHMDAQYGPRWFDGFWQPRFPDQLFAQRVSAQPLVDGVFELEGHELRAVETGHTDTDGSSVLHVPSIGLAVAGDVVYGNVHLYLAEAKETGAQQWLDALDILERLQPRAVVAGHKEDGGPDDPEQIGRTRGYINDFTAAAAQAAGFADLFEAMVARYPDRVNRGVLWNSAKAFLS
ncbi:MBL fold metallo-hydrolase [Catellatospora tritici]|uniref:MBL fold metallo-hydrolase n=1 Tax=Catellatospora tritici TaxID=2851566 RepID=UPI001C2D83B5|nr:MBL fold metallo-hydrolase [Catellatospora tritici]MBV1854358.1 MBL fold metallo-hydrolase [Catellatospora tritici]